jgi:hypothetical protein
LAEITTIITEKHSVRITRLKWDQADDVVTTLRNEVMIINLEN